MPSVSNILGGLEAGHGMLGMLERLAVVLVRLLRQFVRGKVVALVVRGRSGEVSARRKLVKLSDALLVRSLRHGWPP